MRIISGLKPDGPVRVDCDPFHGDRSAERADWLLGHGNAPECFHTVAISFRNISRERGLQQSPLPNGTGIIMARLSVQPFAKISEPVEAHSRDLGWIRQFRRVGQKLVSKIAP